MMEIAALIVIVIGIGVVYLKFRARAKRREAAVNIVLGKATFLSLSHDDQVKVDDRAVTDLNNMMGGRFSGYGFNGEYDRFGCYANAMANLGISPVIRDYCYPRWYLVNNPFFDILPDDPLIEQTVDEVKRKHGVSVSISKEHRFFDKIRKAKAESEQPKSPNAMDAFITTMYGNETKKRADLSKAIHLANTELLLGRFGLNDITSLATDLSNGPVPYSTHDLATAVALGLLRKVPRDARKDLAEVQLTARLTVSTWVTEGKVVPPLAAAFENTLYKDYHPANLTKGSEEPGTN